MDNNKFELLKQITALDFMIVDFNLYLNTHPNDKIALSERNKLAIQVYALKQTYEKSYGLLCSNQPATNYPWNWINEPWPWESEANFKL